MRRRPPPHQTVVVRMAGVQLSHAGAAMKRRVQTQAGPVEGVDGRIKIFRGLPYARPPVGALRWKAPRPLEGWTEVRPAESFGMDCPQIPLPTEPSNGPGVSEDCLY